MKKFKKLISTTLTVVFILNLILSWVSQDVFAVETDWTVSPWTYEKARHLASKVLFAPRKDIVDKLYQAWSATWAVNILFPSVEWPDRTEYDNFLNWSWAEIRWVVNNRFYFYKKYLDPYEAKQKMFLIFEDIFSVDMWKWTLTYLDIENTHDMIYNDMFWTWWYKQMIKDVLYWHTWSYAMWKYLDLFNTRKARPNENYAREFMQLFLMWENKVTDLTQRNYTEDDVASIAKILTWLSYETNTKTLTKINKVKNSSWEVVWYENVDFDENYHIVKYNFDDEDYWHNITWDWDLDWDWEVWDVYFLTWALKWDDSFDFYNSWSWTINLSKITESIDWNNWLWDNLVDFIFSKRENEIAWFLADRFFRFYANMSPTNNDLIALQNIFLKNDLQFYPSIKEFLASDAMYSERSMNTIYYKNPIELTVWSMKVLKSHPQYHDLRWYSAQNFISDLWWDPYLPTSIFWRSWFDENKEFYNWYYNTQWIKRSEKIFYYNPNDNYGYVPEETCYNANCRMLLKDVIPDHQIEETWSYLFSTSTWNTFSWSIAFDEITLNFTWSDIPDVCSWWLVFWSWSVNFPKFDINTNSWWVIDIFSWSIITDTSTSSWSINIFSWSLLYSWATCNISSWTWIISWTWKLLRDYDIDDFFQYAKDYLYVWLEIPDSVKEKLRELLLVDQYWNPIKFDSTNKNYRLQRIIPAIWILLSQPEFIFVSWFDKPKADLSDNKSFFDNKNSKLVVVDLDWWYDWLHWIIPKAEYNTTYQKLRRPVDSSWNVITDLRASTWELLSLNSDFYISKYLQSFKDLYDSWALKIFNRVWVPNQSRWHDLANHEISSINWKSALEASDWILWKMSKNELSSLNNISVWAIPYIYRWWKYTKVWKNPVIFQPYFTFTWKNNDDWTLNDLNKQLIKTFTWVILWRDYPWDSWVMFKWTVDLDSLWVTAWSTMDKHLDFIKSAIEKWVWSTFLISDLYYDTHWHQLRKDSNYPDWFLNNKIQNVADKLKFFYNEVKDDTDITILVISEFWRELKASWSNWTDHWVWWWYFLITNNDEVKKRFPEKVYWKMILSKEKSRFLWVWFDYRSIWREVLDWLYWLPEDYFPSVQPFSDFIDDKKPKIEFLRTRFWARNNDQNALNISFTVDDKNFRLFDGSDVKLYVWDSMDSLKWITTDNSYVKKWNYKRSAQWDTSTTYVEWDWFTLNFRAWVTISDAEKMYYKIIAMDNQFDETIATWSFLVPKIRFYGNESDSFSTERSSRIRKYENTTITWTTLLWTWIVLADAWTWEILFWTWSDWIQMKAFSWTTTITSITSTWWELKWHSSITSSFDSFNLKWNWTLILPHFVNLDTFVPRYAILNWEVVSDLGMKKIVKVWTDILWAQMDLDQEVEITVPWFWSWEVIDISSSLDWINWNLFQKEVVANWSWEIIFKTNKLLYFWFTENHFVWDFTLLWKVKKISDKIISLWNILKNTFIELVKDMIVKDSNGSVISNFKLEAPEKIEKTNLQENILEKINSQKLNIKNIYEIKNNHKNSNWEKEKIFFTWSWIKIKIPVTSDKSKLKYFDETTNEWKILKDWWKIIEENWKKFLETEIEELN